MYWLQFAFEFFDFWMLQRQVKASKFSFWKIQFFISRCFYQPQIDSQPQKINSDRLSRCVKMYRWIRRLLDKRFWRFYSNKQTWNPRFDLYLIINKKLIGLTLQANIKKLTWPGCFDVRYEELLSIFLPLVGSHRYDFTMSASFQQLNGFFDTKTRTDHKIFLISVSLPDREFRLKIRRKIYFWKISLNQKLCLEITGGL